MQELFEQIVDYLKGIWLKRRFIILSTWLICPPGWFFIAQLEDTYESSARVYVDTQSLLRPLLKGLTVETNPNVQINLMVQTLLSRPNLEKIARMTDLDIRANTPEEFDVIIDNLKASIEISRSGRDNIYDVTVENNDPVLAKNVVQSTLNVFIENTLGDSRSDSDSAQKFLNEQIRDYENRLLAAEARRTQFKQKYSGILPDQSGGYYGALNNEKARLKEAELMLREAKSKLESAKSQLAEPTTSADASTQAPETTEIRTQFDERIAQLEANLDGLLVRYTDEYPDVKEIKRRLDVLKKQRSTEIEQIMASLKGDKSGSIASSIEGSTLYQEMKLLINNLEAEVASLTVRVAEYKANVADLEAKIHTIPEIEAEMTALNRDYDITKSKYEELLERKETAQLAQQADSTTDKISFNIIDPPRVPVEASGPKRILMFIGITIVAFGAGIALSLLFSQLRPVVTSAAQLNRATGIPILGVISATENLQLHKWQTKKTIIFIISNLALVGLLVCFMAYFLLPDLVQAPIKRIIG